MLQKIGLAFLFIKFKSNHGIENIPLLVEIQVLGFASNEAVEKVCSYAHRAVNQTKYQGPSFGRYFGAVNGTYKHIDTSPKFLAVGLQRQLLPGTFEHALNHLLDHELELSGFDFRFNDDVSGAVVYPPAMLLKVIRVSVNH